MISILKFLKFLHVILASSFVLAAPFSSTDYVQNSIAGIKSLQDYFYDSSSGLWAALNTSCNCRQTVWWNSAVITTILADLAAIDSSTRSLTDPILQNTYNKAYLSQVKQDRLSATERCEWSSNLACNDREPIIENIQGFINGWYDDEGWWALAWLKVYDIMGDDIYLRTAVDIFDDMAFTGYNGTCGAMYWDRARTYQNAIANELFLAVSANLANRVENKQYYLDWALKQWNWFKNSGMLNNQNLINDGLTDDCKNNGKQGWTYNQGVILGALVELNTAQPNKEYLDYATNIAYSAIANMVDNNGVLTEPGFNGNPNMGGDLPQFKGIFIRNLQILQDATGNKDFAEFIKKNADSIWSNDRSADNGTFGTVWDHYYGQLLPQGHGSALATIVAAAAV
jgi:predicted alpha-1,6-mannanase (GH76 family)